MRSFEEVRETDAAPDAILPVVITGLSGPLGKDGYVLQTQSDRIITFARSYRPWWLWIGVIFLFPIGLLFLLVKHTATITIVLEPTESRGTRVRINGQGGFDVRAAFKQMEI